MGSLRFGDFSDSPAMILPPPQHSFDPVSSYHNSLQQYHSCAPIRPMDISLDSQIQPAITSSPSIVNPSPASNKRKRNDFSDETESSLHHQHQTMTPPSLAAWDEAMYGEGMSRQMASLATIIPGYVTIPSSKKVLKPLPKQSLRADGEPIAPPRQKYQRRESSTVKATSSPKATMAEPVIDHFSHLLGVGWNRISPDPDTQAATRGWARYIENHYHLSDVEILLTSKAFEGACLVCARNGAHKGYFLFSEDLGQARLVAYNWDICVGRLQSSPLTFQTEETLMAARTPTLGATMMGGGACAMLPRPDMNIAALPADDLMIFD